MDKIQAAIDSNEDLREVMAFVPVSDAESFNDWDQAEGYGVCLPLVTGIVCEKALEEAYKDLVQRFEKR
jgi:hypothetical protein